MPAYDWFPVLSKEYLDDFIKNGGAAVKFVVPWDPAEQQPLKAQLGAAAREKSYAFVSLDAATTKLHMIDKLFNDVARQIAWNDLTYAFMAAMLSEGQYRAPDTPADFNLAHLAALNGLDRGSMRAIINNRLQEKLYRDYAMTHEFRMAMLRLCQVRLDPEDLGAGVAEAVQEWLTGDLRLISPLKSASIFQKIGRHNARDMFSSLCHWLRLAGKSGLVLTLDIGRFMEQKRPRNSDGTLYYTPAAVLDGYEVLRQFIDSADELQYCLTIVFAPPSFLLDEQRGVRRYEALYFRVWDEVRDRRRANPLASLVRFDKQEEPAALETVGELP